MGPEGSFPCKQEIVTGSYFQPDKFSPYYISLVQTGSEAHLPSYPMGKSGFSPGVKCPGRAADHSPPSSAEVKKM
jgi:hypothetical protein